MHQIKLDGKHYSGPDSWKELGPKRFLHWVRWQLSGADPAGLFGLIALWFKLKYHLVVKLSDDQRIFMLEQLMSFLLVRPSVWMLPRLRVLFRRYRGPGDRLQHLSFGEFMFAETARNGFDEIPTKAQLAELAAALYRPHDSAGAGNRAPFIQAALEAQEKRFLWLHRDTLDAIRLNYMGCVDLFPERFTYLFPKKPSGGGQGGTWLDAGLSLARQTGALGNFHELEKTNVYLVLTVLDDVMREQAELEAKSKTNGL